MRLDRTSEAISSDVTSHDIVQAVFAGFRTLRTTHTADDVRRAIVKALGTWAAVTLRDGGGIYWVPAVYATELRRLQGAIEKIGTPRVHVLPMHESQDANRALGAIATASLEAELAQLQAEIAAFGSMPPERTSTLTRRLEAFAAFQNDGAPVRCPLVSLFAASNELPEGKELEALFDRFLLRFDVGYLLVAQVLQRGSDRVPGAGSVRPRSGTHPCQSRGSRGDHEHRCRIAASRTARRCS